MKRQLEVCLIALCAAAVARAQRAPGGEVHGYVSALFDRREIPLPDVRVFLRAAGGGPPVAGATSVSNTRGYYRIPYQPSGKYRVCGEAANFEAGCAEKDIEVTRETAVQLPHLVLKPVGKAVYGSVTLKDGSPAANSGSSLRPAGGAAQVSVVNAAGQTVAGPVRANLAGNYVIPNVPAGTDVRVSIKYEGAAESKALPGDAVRFDLGILNTPPRIESLVARLGGKPVSLAPPGSTVQVTVKAADAEHDALHYGWYDSSGTLKPEDKASIRWKLPPTANANTLFVDVSDGKGGITRASLNVRTGAASAKIAALVHAPTAGFFSILPLSVNPLYKPPPHSGKFIDEAPNSEAETIEYYKAIGVFDQTGKPTAALGTLANWRSTYGFSPDPLKPVADEVRAVYYNNGDLKLGRDMHCRQTPESTGVQSACYVTNFSDTDAAGGDPLSSIFLALENTNPVATVAMTYAAKPSPQVNFFVYGGDGAAATFYPAPLQA